MAGPRLSTREITGRGTYGSANTAFRHFIRRFFSHKPAVLGISIVFIICSAAAFAPLLAPYNPMKIGFAPPHSGPTTEHLLGVDAVGRDNLSRLIYGARASLLVGIGAVALQVLIGTFIGGVAGYWGGLADSLAMRLTDVILSFPLFVVAVAAVSIVGPGITNMVAVVGLLGWPRIARLVRAEVLSLRTFPYIEATRSLGGSPARILLIHILPNTLPTIMVAVPLGISRAVLLAAGLSFLGMGVQPPTPSWGNILANAQSLTILETMPWMWIPAGLCLMVLVLSVNFVGDGLRDALDPRAKL